MDAVITGLFGLAVAVVGLFGARIQAAVSAKPPAPTDAAVADHEHRLHHTP